MADPDRRNGLLNGFLVELKLMVESKLVTYQTESWLDCHKEILTLGIRHWEEVNADPDIPLDMDLNEYARMTLAGQFHVTTVRKAGAMIGYCAVIVRPHLHYRTLLCGYFDFYWLEPQDRLGFNWVGLKMFKHVEQELTRRGVKKLFTGTKLSHDAGAVFKRLGWKNAESLWAKRIGT